MLIGFQDRFADDVAAGRKRQTIRAERRDGRHAAVGDELHCYARLRRRGERARLLGRFRCTLSERIELSIERGAVLGDVVLIGDALEDLAERDGFACFDELLAFFDGEHGLPFRGRLYRW